MRPVLVAKRRDVARGALVRRQAHGVRQLPRRRDLLPQGGDVASGEECRCRRSRTEEMTPVDSASCHLVLSFGSTVNLPRLLQKSNCGVIRRF
jgi:hypothetical protein